MHRTQGNCKRKRDADKSQGTIFDFFMPKPHRDDDGRGPPPAPEKEPPPARPGG